MRQVLGNGPPHPATLPLFRAKVHLVPGGLTPHSTGRGRNVPTKQMGKARPQVAEL